MLGTHNLVNLVRESGNSENPPTKSTGEKLLDFGLEDNNEQKVKAQATEKKKLRFIEQLAVVVNTLGLQV